MKSVCHTASRTCVLWQYSSGGSGFWSVAGTLRGQETLLWRWIWVHGWMTPLSPASETWEGTAYLVQWFFLEGGPTMHTIFKRCGHSKSVPFQKGWQRSPRLVVPLGCSWHLPGSGRALRSSSRCVCAMSLQFGQLPLLSKVLRLGCL